jgi:hypothetical protein
MGTTSKPEGGSPRAPEDFRDLSQLHSWFVKEYRGCRREGRLIGAVSAILYAAAWLNKHYSWAWPPRPIASELRTVDRADRAFSELCARIESLSYSQSVPAQASEQTEKAKAGTSQDDAMTLATSPESQAKRRKSPGRNAEARKRTEMITKWERAKGTGTAQKVFCKDNGITTGDLNRWLDWKRKRKKRGQI